MTQPTLLTHLSQAFPQYIGQETNKQMRLNPLLFLMPDRPERQVTLLDSKGCLGFSQMNIGVPQFLGRPISDIGAQHVASPSEIGPTVTILSLGPSETQTTSLLFHDFYLIQTSRTTISLQ
jgi:hypothetical protein